MRHLIRTAAALFLLCALPAAAARAKETQYLTYNIYTGGLKTISAALQISEDQEDDYQMRMDARTDGLLSLFKKWQGTMKTQGHELPGGEMLPSWHKAVSVWPDNTQIKQFRWNENGTLTALSIRDKDEEKGLNEKKRELARNAVDILSASLAIMENAGEQGTCGGKTEVFDGKRRFQLTAIDKGWDTLNRSRYNQYAGRALRCEIRIIPQDGNWHKKLKGWMSIQGEGKEAGSAPVVWLAKLDEDGPAVPVKVMAKTSYGTFLMHLSGYSIPD